MDIHDIQKLIKKERLLIPEGFVVIGVSGGADSLCLMECLWRLDYDLVVVHFNHGLRPESDSEAQFVQSEADKRGVPFETLKKDVASIARANKWTIEEAARKVRYPFLFNVANMYQAQAVAVAHNADDQVETILLNLIRGTGLDGLRGMRYRSINPEWDEKIPLIRPLLATWRHEIDDFCLQNGLNPVLDPSNLDTTYTRNRVRHELIPQLETFNMQAKQRIFQMGQILDVDHQLISKQLESAWVACYVKKTEDWVQFDLEDFLIQPAGLQARIIRRGIKLQRPNYWDLDFNTIQRALAFLEKPSASMRMDLTANLDIFIRGSYFYLVESGKVIILEAWPQVNDARIIQVDIPGNVDLGNGWLLTINKISMNFDRSLLDNRDDPFEVFLDADRFVGALTIRSRRAGDRFEPLGMRGKSMKLSDFMVNEKLPRAGRQKWPLLFDEKGLVWVPGYRPGDRYRVSAETLNMVKCELKSKDEKDAS